MWPGLYRELLAGSGIRESHRDCDKVQDPYSLRCQPQVMGACLDSIGHVARILEIEANAATDNPLVFAADDAVLSGGNFHAEPVGFAADCLAVAVAEIGAMSERRTAVMVDPKMSNLPAFLVPDSGLNSGFMIAQVTAAALVSENKSLAHPASVDSIPTCANQEDHVSMATYAARRLTDMTRNAATVVGIELLCAGQGIEFHRPLKSSPALMRALALLRQRVTNYDHDRLIHPDIEAATALIEAGELGGRWRESARRSVALARYGCSTLRFQDSCAANCAAALHSSIRNVIASASAPSWKPSVFGNSLNVRSRNSSSTRNTENIASVQQGK